MHILHGICHEKEQNTISDHSVQIIFEAKKPSKSDKRVGVVGFD